MDFLEQYFRYIGDTANRLDRSKVVGLIQAIKETREKRGRLFILGIGGSAGNAAHAVNDFRKLCGVEAYAPTDNVSELTARTNDEGWDTVFSEWLKISNLGKKDALLIFSVGGGDEERNVSVNLINAIKLARTCQAKVLGIVGRAGGYTAQNADEVVVIPSPDVALITPISEAYQAVIWHGIVSHPSLQLVKTKW